MYLGWIITIIAGIIAITLGIPLIISASGHFIKGINKKSRCHEGQYLDTWTGGANTMCVFAVISAIIFVVSGLASITTRSISRGMYYEWLEQSEMIERVINEGEEYENFMITQDIIDYNKGIAGAKASQKSWGCASSWYGYDLSKLKYIRVPLNDEITEDLLNYDINS